MSSRVPWVTEWQGSSWAAVLAFLSSLLLGVSDPGPMACFPPGEGRQLLLQVPDIGACRAVVKVTGFQPILAGGNLSSLLTFPHHFCPKCQSCGLQATSPDKEGAAPLDTRGQNAITT